MKALTFEPGAFNQALRSIIGNDKVGWYAPDHEKLVDALLPRLRDEDGNVADLGEQVNILKLVLCPTEERQRSVMTEAFAAAGYELDENTEGALGLLLNVNGLSDHLAKKVNPSTGQPYIRKVAKGGKKKALDALLDEQPASAEAPTASKRSKHEAAVA